MSRLSEANEEIYNNIKKYRQENICLFKDDHFKCLNGGKTGNNHLISRKGYLTRIADNKNEVKVFKFENVKYLRHGMKLESQNIKSATTFNVLCSNHDGQLFKEIESQNPFDEKNNKQLFQFAFRALLFSYSEQVLKDKFDNVSSPTLNKRAKAHLLKAEQTLKKYRDSIETENWESVEHVIIKLNKKCEFISCWSGNLSIGTNFKFRLSPNKISINIFPNGAETIILLSYLKNDPLAFAFDKRYFQKLKKLSETNETKFIEYIQKIIIAFDHNIAISPTFWSSHDKESKSAFYEIAHLLTKVQNSRDAKKQFITRIIHSYLN